MKVREFLVKFDEVFRELFAVQQTYALDVGITRTDINQRTRIVGEGELNFRLSERRPSNLTGDVIQFRRLAFEKFQPRRDIVEQVVDCDVCPRRATAFLNRPHDTTFNSDLCAL